MQCSEMEAREMAQRLSANNALAEDLNLVPGTLIGQITVASTPIPGDLPPSSGLPVHLHSQVHLITHRRHMHTTEK